MHNENGHKRLNTMRFAFVGQNIIGGMTLQALIQANNKPHFVVTRHPLPYTNLVQEIATQRGIEYIFSSDLNNDISLCDRIRTADFDFLLCCSWSHRIKQPLLTMPRRGWVNFHPSLLPKYRGSRPLEWQLINGERHAGCTSHFMTDQFDAGNIILQNTYRISSSDNGETLRIKAGFMMGRLAVETIKLLRENQEYHGIPQNNNDATYAPPVVNNRRIDWNRSAEQIDRQVRALYPYPNAIFTYNNFEVAVAHIEITTMPSNSQAPGYVFFQKGKLFVATMDYYVKIVSIRINDQTICDYRL